ncbi:hypothetical protein K523DRAFT_110757 [Schizophyllum commune Tattone D]|nr:hypothetical protein K523DRAFT_110757 [Schizophyllum commune Tattone D]
MSIPHNSPMSTAACSAARPLAIHSSLPYCIPNSLPPDSIPPFSLVGPSGVACGT